MSEQTVPQHLLFSSELEAKLQEFSQSGNRQVTPELGSILQNIAENGVVCFDWSHMRPLIEYELVRILREANAEVNDLEPKKLEQGCSWISDALEDLDGAPFTMQRVCEVICSNDPVRSAKKLLFAIEKLLSVSTVMVREQNPSSWQPREDAVLE